ncbi:MAG: hypothetical protein ACK4N5_04445, partial [Myxococcales bacterium]
FVLPGVSRNAAARAPARAVTASVTELILAWKKGELPTSTFAAAHEVAFPDPEAPGLAEKFAAKTPAAHIDALVKGVDWFAKVPWIGPGLTAKHVTALFSALPSLMGELRASVARDLEGSPELRLRLPAAYRDAFLQLR